MDPLTVTAMEQRRFQGIQNDPNIARFVVEGTTTGRQLGTGSYGSVEEVCCLEIRVGSMW